HKTYGSLKHAIDTLEIKWLKGRRCKFTFTGGEPTFNPEYMTIIKELVANKHVIHTTTNGSRTAKYYAELLEMSSIGFSIHLDFYKKDKLEEIVKTLINEKKTNDISKFNWT